MFSRSPATRRAHAWRNDTTLLLAVGFALFASGIALVVAPEYSPRARSLADTLAHSTGIQSGVLVLGGLVFFSLGVLSRGIGRPGSVPSSSARGKRDGAADGSPSAEQVTQITRDLAQLRSVVQQVSSDVGNVSQTVERLLQAGQAQGQPRDQGDPQQPQENDPLFRLAGSLDSMNARFDERLNALTAQLRDVLGTGKDAGSPSSSRANEPPAARASAAKKDSAAMRGSISLEDDDEPGVSKASSSRPSAAPTSVDDVDSLLPDEESQPARKPVRHQASKSSQKPGGDRRRKTS